MNLVHTILLDAFSLVMTFKLRITFLYILICNPVTYRAGLTFSIKEDHCNWMEQDCFSLKYLPSSHQNNFRMF